MKEDKPTPSPKTGLEPAKARTLMHMLKTGMEVTNSIEPIPVMIQANMIGKEEKTCIKEETPTPATLLEEKT